MPTDTLPSSYNMESVLAWMQYMIGPGSGGLIAGVAGMVLAFYLFRAFYRNVIGAFLGGFGGSRHGKTDGYQD